MGYFGVWEVYKPEKKKWFVWIMEQHVIFES